MATQVVELTSDEAALLRGLDKVIQKERQHERQLAETAAAGGKAATKSRAGLPRRNAKRPSDEGGLRELAKFGPAGQAAAGELKSSFEASGSFGFKGLDDVFADLEKLDPAAAQAARAAAMKIQSEMAAADAATEFNNTLTAIESLGGAASVAAKRVSDSLKEPGNNAEGLAHYLDELRSLGPAGARRLPTASPWNLKRLTRKPSSIKRLPNCDRWAATRERSPMASRPTWRPPMKLQPVT